MGVGDLPDPDDGGQRGTDGRDHWVSRGIEAHPEQVEPAGDGEKPNARSGAAKSANAFERYRLNCRTSATLRTTNPAAATTKSAGDSHDGPSVNVPIEMMPVANTNAK